MAELVALIRERLAGPDGSAGGLAGAIRRPDFCASRCCVNARVTRPTTAAVDSAADAEFQFHDLPPCGCCNHVINI